MIKRLSEAFGVSGYEKPVAEIIKTELLDSVTNIKTDSIGNLIVTKINGGECPTIVIATHMDECGFIITDITDNGYLKFDTIGKIPAQNLISKKVVINGTTGIIALKAIHLTPKEEREKPIKVENLFIDIGATSKKEAEQIVTIGDYSVFISEFSEFGENSIKGKALDNRIGCKLLIDVFKNPQFEKINIVGIFTAQKEISARGALIAARNIDDAKKIILIGGREGKCGEGVIIGINKDTICNEIINIADKNNLKYQTENSVKDAFFDAFKSQKADIPCVSVDVPCKYVKTPVTVADKSDIATVYNLICSILEEENNA